MEDEAKQWIIIRTDLDMPVGKIASQAAHAAMKAAILDYAEWKNTCVSQGSMTKPSTTLTLTFEDDSALGLWLKGIFTKVCLAAKSEEQLMEKYETAEAHGLQTCLIEDVGRTCFDGVKTITACAVGPAMVSEVRFLRDLPLLK